MSITTQPKLDGGPGTDDFDGHAHYAEKNGMVEAMIYGTVVVALCGYRFIPMRDPQGLPVCETCKKIHASLPPGGGDE